jgi:RNA polymerase sigma-70 factor (ECF subfamily)
MNLAIKHPKFAPDRSETSTGGPKAFSNTAGRAAFTGAMKPRHAPSLEFDYIFMRWSERVASWIRALGAPPADVDDLVQDVFVIVHRRLPYFDGRNVAAWLYQIVRRQVRDFRRLNWTNLMSTHSVPLSKNLCKLGPSPADRLETKEKGERLERALSKLNPDQRAAFVLLEIEGYSGEEIAQLQSVPVNTVWSRISVARKKLHARL